MKGKERQGAHTVFCAIPGRASLMCAAAFGLLALIALLLPGRAAAELNLSEAPTSIEYAPIPGEELAEPTAIPGPPAEPNPMRWNGGFVQHRPHVHLIFWGSEWNSYPGDRTKIIGAMQWINNPSYMGVFSQYFDEHGPIGKEVDLSVVTDTRVVHPNSISRESLGAEALWAQANQGWGVTTLDDQYTVVLPPGTTYAMPLSCGFHEWSATYGKAIQFLPYPSSEHNICRNSVPGQPAWAEMQAIATHEFAETVTNPIPQINGNPVFAGWAYAANESIVDVCDQPVEVAAGIVVEKLLDNYLYAAAGQRCVAQDVEPVRYTATTGQVTDVSAATHSAVLHGSVTPAGYPAKYQFEVNGGQSTQLPSTAGSLGSGFGPVPVAQTLTNLKGNTMYVVNLKSTSLITESLKVNPGHVSSISGGPLSFTTPDWRPKLSNVTATPGKLSAVLKGTVDGQTMATSYHFEYGPTASYGSSVPVPDASSGTSVANVSQTVEGIEGTYHYRLVASNAEGTTVGPDQTFYVQERPVVAAEEPAEVTPDGGKLAASVNPKGSATSYFFEYGKTASYGSKTASFSAGAASTAVTVTAAVSGLEFGTTYHYRVVAENFAGTRTGADTTFTPGWRRGSVPTSEVKKTEAFLNGVYCLSSTNCFAAGNTVVPQAGVPGPIIDRFDGTKWTTQELANVAGGYEGVLYGVACPSASSCLAVGSYKKEPSFTEAPQAEIWNGTNWSAKALPVPAEAQLTKAVSISCPATNFCVAAGTMFDPHTPGGPLFIDGYLVKWDGSNWTQWTVPLPAGGLGAILTSVSCTSSTNCWAVGNAIGPTTNDAFAYAYRWNGTQWTSQVLPKVGTTNFGRAESVSCTSTTACTAVGIYKDPAGKVTPNAYRWDGTQWKVETLPAPSGTEGALRAVSCSSATVCEAVGVTTNPQSPYFADRLRSGAWDVQTTPVPSSAKMTGDYALNGISCAGEGECTAVGWFTPEEEVINNHRRPFAETFSKTLGASSGPTAAYAFDEGTGTSAKDAAGSHTATLTSTSWVEGKFGKALSFNGTSSCATVPNSADLQLSGPFTLETWVKPTTLKQGAPIFFKEDESFYGYSLFFGAFEEGHVEGFVAEPGHEWSEVESPEKLTANTWANAAMTFDGTTLRLYINGKQVDSGPAKAALESKGPLLIGCAKNFSQYFNGAIDNPRIYNRALSAAEIEANKTTPVTPPPPPPSGPTAAYGFNEGSGTTVNDAAGTHTGTATSPTWVEGKFGKAISFNGTSSCVSVPNSVDLQLSGSFTIEAQVNPTTLKQGAPIFFKEAESFYGYSMFFGAFEEGHVEGFIADKSENWTEVESPEKLAVNTWTQVAMTSDGTTFKLFVGGKQVDTGSAKAAAESNGPLLIGCAKNFAQYFNGKIDNVRIYPRALSGAEIETNKGTGI
ncbi:MAG: LamG-like jellyroll fold domain-containing protein [Solirubrobacterales bacterium]